MMFTFQFPDADIAAKWQQFRLWRNDELAATDWTQVGDSPVDKIAWAEYRQALRDIPSRYDHPDKIIVPARPSRDNA